MENNEDIFDKYIQNNEKLEKKEETKKQEILNQTETSIEPKKQSIISTFLNHVVKYAETSGEELSEKTKSFAVDIITMANKTILSQGTLWNEVDIAGSGFISQIKRWSKLGISSVDKLYIDVRNNGKTGKKDIAIKGQYQTIEKLLVKYYSKKIVRFKTEVICNGDVIEEEEDFVTGLNKITNHKRNFDIDRNNLENIVGAYKIAYVEDKNGLYQVVVRIDKNRIDRAYNASPSKEKTVWKQDSIKMVKKTVTWEMWNNENIRAFMVFPEDVLNDITVISENEEMNWDEEKKYNSVYEAQSNIKSNVATSDILDVKYEGN